MRVVASLIVALLSATSAPFAAEPPGVVLREFLYEAAPYPECHASTIVETPAGLVAAWFGGTEEKHPDVGIHVSRQIGGRWNEAVEVANGIQYSLPDGSTHRHPTWNPVLFQQPAGPLLLFWKCGPSPDTWWGLIAESNDHGATWSEPRRLPEHIDGPVRNKPLLLSDGTLLCGSSTEFDGWRIHFESTRDGGRTWQRTPVINDGKTTSAIQPTLLKHPDGRIQALCRDQNNNGSILSTSSQDGGKSWSELTAIHLPNPNSGIDAVSLADGRHLLVYNHTRRSEGEPRGREMLNVAISDDGDHWKPVMTLDREDRAEFSYPAVIQSSDGLVHITWTWKRQRIRHQVLEPQALVVGEFADGAWPEDR